MQQQYQQQAYQDNFTGQKIALQNYKYLLLIDFVDIQNKYDAIIEISIMLYDEKQIQQFKQITFIKPTQKLLQLEEQKLGIYNQDIQRAPTFKQFIEQVESNKLIQSYELQKKSFLIVYPQKTKRMIFKEQYEKDIGKMNKLWESSIYLDEYFYFDCYNQQSSMQLDGQFSLIKLYNKLKGKPLRKNIEIQSSIYSLTLMKQIIFLISNNKQIQMSLYHYTETEQIEEQKIQHTLKQEQQELIESQKILVQQQQEQQVKYNENVSKIELNHIPKQLTIFEDVDEDNNCNNCNKHDFHYFLILHPIKLQQLELKYRLVIIIYEIITQKVIHNFTVLIYPYNQNQFYKAIKFLNYEILNCTNYQAVSIVLFNLEQPSIQDLLQILSHFDLPSYFSHYIPLQKCWNVIERSFYIQSFNQISHLLRLNQNYTHTDKLLEIIKTIQNRNFYWTKSLQERLILFMK